MFHTENKTKREKKNRKRFASHAKDNISENIKKDITNIWSG